MNIWIFQTAEPLHCDEGHPRAMRAMNLSNALVDSGHTVILWSSAFYHQEKKHRTRDYQKIKINDQLEIRLIPSIGYKRNIGLKRLIDHADLALKLKKHLSDEQTIPDVAFVGYPPIEFSSVISKWLKDKNIPFYLDIKDQWPQIFVDTFPWIIRPVARILFYPYYVLALNSMRQATGLASITQSFLDWSIRFSKRTKTKWDIVLPLVSSPPGMIPPESSDAENFWSQAGVDLSHNKRFIFIGSLSRAFDFKYVFSAAKKLIAAGTKCEFVICGTGEEHDKLKKLSLDIENVIFPGWIDMPKMQLLMSASLATIAPYKSTSDFRMSIPNKIIDSLAFGLPVITGLTGEVQDLLMNASAGLFCEESVISWERAFNFLLNNPDKQLQISVNAKQLYNERFEYNVVYRSIVHNLEAICTQTYSSEIRT